LTGKQHSLMIREQKELRKELIAIRFFLISQESQTQTLTQSPIARVIRA